MTDELLPRERSQKERLARYMDPQAFSERVGRERRDAMRARREIANKRAAAAIRFFNKPEERAILDQRGDHKESQ